MNLSATAAPDGSGGLFFERNPETVDVFHSQQYRAMVAFSEPSHSLVREVLGGPINKGAWVFQERMLATRVLHFCRSRLFWECCTLQKAEPLSVEIPVPMEIPPEQTKQLVLPRPRGQLSPDTARMRWAGVLETYSRTSLSFRADTVLALSAIATRLCEQRDFELRDYAAGLWVPDLKKDSEDYEEGVEESEADNRDGSFDRIEGLILHRSSAKGEYARLGLFYYTLQTGAEQDEEVLGHVFGKDECLDVNSYLQKDGDGEHAFYTIKIV
ncbi:hypothetical protein CGLO_13638 [Colletotrichum gloeosporioides Cg-14]|uniref:Heterokaryon incompatibility domain-containing protein n=1 Tax=Colletotrichum gloeosporioides (strain Cg-14) TaxID=1237896 RepID=T0LG70_COLGC|nr:hypothetical protein CGLO_13638 [Colletotrichum gloeosporioides Cg-14]